MTHFVLATLLLLSTFSPSVSDEAADTSTPPVADASASAAASPVASADVPSSASVLQGATVLPTGLLAPDVEERVSAGFLETMDLIYAGRIVESLSRAEELIVLAPEDPRPYLLKARVLREHVSEQDNVREHVKPQIEPILAVIELAEKKSEAILAKDPDSAAGFLYRGWAKFFKGQLHELAFEHWSAGRSAKAGKDDLDRVLARDPNNPDALMIVGTYLYFADLLPKALKIASFVLRIPSGDRKQGLEFLQRAEGIRSYSQRDARGMRGAILFAFEGELEDASDLFDAFDDQFPDNPRLVEPLAMLDIWFAERTGVGTSRIARVVKANESGGDSFSRALAERLRLYEAYMEILTGHVEEGRANLARLHRDNPGGPDWFRTVVDLYLADVYLLLGDRDRAIVLRGEAVPDQDLERVLRYTSAEGAAASGEDVDTFHRLQDVAQALYGGRLDEADTALQGFPEGPLVEFYRGELLHLRGQNREALPHYEALLGPTVPARCRLFARVSRLRIAEIYGSLGEWQTAAETFDDEIEKYVVKDMWRHVARARQRYFLKQADAVRG